MKRQAVLSQVGIGNEISCRSPDRPVRAAQGPGRPIAILILTAAMAAVGWVNPHLLPRASAADSSAETRASTDPNARYRDFYASCKTLVLKAAQAGDANEVARLTQMFNASIGGHLLHARVTMLLSGKHVTLLNKFLSDPPLNLPQIHYASTGQTHVSAVDGYILIETAKKAPGADAGYEDDIYIVLAVNPAASVFADVVEPSARLLADISSFIPARWQFTVTTETGQMGHPHGLGEPAFRIDFVNPTESFDDTSAPGKVVKRHPSLRLHFHRIADKQSILATIKAESHNSWDIPTCYCETPDYLVITSPGWVNQGHSSQEARELLAPLEQAIKLKKDWNRSPAGTRHDSSSPATQPASAPAGWASTQAYEYQLLHPPFSESEKERYLDMLHTRRRIVEPAQACVKFGWKEAIPSLNAIYTQPRSLGEFAAAFQAKRALEGAPLADVLRKLQQDFQSVPYTQEPMSTESLAKAKETLLASKDTEAVGVIAIQLALCNAKASNDRQEPLRRLGRDVLLALPDEQTWPMVQRLAQSMDGPFEREQLARLLNLLPTSSAPATEPSAWSQTAPPLPEGWDGKRLLEALAKYIARMADDDMKGYELTWVDNRQIRLAWQTQEQDVVRPTSKIGDKTEVRREVGPGTSGLIVTIWLQDGIGQAVRPQTFANGKWTTYGGPEIHIRELKPLSERGEGKVYAISNIDYGPYTPRELITKFALTPAMISAAIARATAPGTQPAASTRAASAPAAGYVGVLTIYDRESSVGTVARREFMENGRIVKVIHYRPAVRAGARAQPPYMEADLAEAGVETHKYDDRDREIRAESTCHWMMPAVETTWNDDNTPRRSRSYDANGRPTRMILYRNNRPVITISYNLSGKVCGLSGEIAPDQDVAYGWGKTNVDGLAVALAPSADSGPLKKMSIWVTVRNTGDQDRTVVRTGVSAPEFAVEVRAPDGSVVPQDEEHINARLERLHRMNPRLAADVPETVRCGQATLLAWGRDLTNWYPALPPSKYTMTVKCRTGDTFDLVSNTVGFEIAAEGR